ncbi:MAG: hypothetical protein HY331_09555 [Chloroflexi bacterium]|nr:hypothetical protein [Chloroflexota bacterium]
MLQTLSILLIPFVAALLATIGLRLASGGPVAGNGDEGFGTGYFVVFFLAVGATPLVGLLAILMSAGRP